MLLFCSAMSFRRTAISLIIIAFVTAGVAAVYLWYNFTAKSNIVLMVPEKCQWFYHFQTKKIRSATSKDKPVYLDSIAGLIAGFPVFKNVKDPGDIGVTLFSDILLFGNEYGEYAALSVNSEPRLTRFFSELAPKGMFGGVVKTSFCNFVKTHGRNVYFAYKHKALIIFRPKDTTDNLAVIEKGLAEVFAEKSRKPVTTIPAVRELYDADCQVVFYSATGKPLTTHGFQYGESGSVSVKVPTGSPNLPTKEALSLFSHSGQAENIQIEIPELKDPINALNYTDLNLKFLYHWLLKQK